MTEAGGTERADDGHGPAWPEHRVLEEYLTAWSHKLSAGAVAEPHLWYVDVFAGPWESKNDTGADTSIAIGLKALNDPARTWQGLGRTIRLHAAFVEKASSP